MAAIARKEKRWTMTRWCPKDRKVEDWKRCLAGGQQRAFGGWLLVA
jgi:hypothetical protein